MESNLLCRSCLCLSEPETLTSLDATLSSINMKTIWEGLCHCTSLNLRDIQDSRIPQSICQQCLDELIVTFRFRQTCEDSENILKQSLFNTRKGESEELQTEKLQGNVKEKVDKSGFQPSIEANPLVVTQTLHRPETDVAIFSKRRRRKYKDSPDQVSLEKKLYMCEECGKTFARLHDLHRHHIAHTKDRPLNCEICQKSFKSHGAIHQHMSTHNDTEKKECSICQKQFSFASALRHHMEVHADEKTLQCEFCDKRFGTEYALKQHIAIHKRMTLRKFQCDQCGVSFKHECHLKQHMFTHIEQRPFGCPQCGKSFKTRHDLGRHSIYHDGKRAFGCRHCPKAFLLKSALDRHLRTHTKEKPYVCTICEKRFAYQSSLKKHYSTHKEILHTCDQVKHDIVIQTGAQDVLMEPTILSISTVAGK